MILKMTKNVEKNLFLQNKRTLLADCDFIFPSEMIRRRMKIDAENKT